MLETCQQGSRSGGGGEANRGSIVEMEVGLFDTLPMISLWVRQTEETLFEKVTADCQQGLG